MLVTCEPFAISYIFPFAVSAAVFIVLRFLNHDDDRSVSHFQCSLDGISQTDTDRLLNDQSVDNRGDVVRFILIDRWDAFDVIDVSVEPHAHKTFALDLNDNILMLALLAADKRSANLYLGPLWMCKNGVHDLRGMLTCDGRSAFVAMGFASAGK